MQPGQSPTYFTFQETPPPPQKWYQNKAVVRRVAIGAAALAAAALVTVLVVNIVRDQTAGPRSALEAARQEVENRQSECEEGDTACLSRAQTGVARVSGQAAACDGLEGKEYTNCVMLVALEKKSTEACGELSGEEKTDCLDKVALTKVNDGGGMETCSAISDTTFAATCRVKVTNRAKREGTCAELGVDASVCESAAQLEAIYVAGDMDACSQLGEELKMECIDYFQSMDIDGDGLSAAKESELGTSDRKTDTDGDGYSDDVEVKSGYDPLH